jgi:hypothetical protein
MQIFDLNTVQPSGADDTTLETGELGDIDRNGSAAFERVLACDYSEAAKIELANFLAAQVMRDPQTIASYKPKTQEYALALLGALDATDYGSFVASLSVRFPGTDGRFLLLRGPYSLPHFAAYSSRRFFSRILASFPSPNACQEIASLSLGYIC